MFVYILQGEHFHIPGTPITAHATKASANAEAASLVNLMLEDSDIEHCTATAENWKRPLSRLRTRYDDQCDVWITKLEIRGAL